MAEELVRREARPMIRRMPLPMRRRRILLFAALLVVCVSCDHGAKRLAGSYLTGGASVSLLGDALRLELVHNHGAFLSVGARLPAPVRSALLLVLAPLGLAAVCALALRAGPASAASAIGLALLAGGGLGNWLDRLVHAGAVTDFASLGLGRLRTGVFNLADVCIAAGVALLLAAPSRSSGIGPLESRGPRSDPAGGGRASPTRRPPPRRAPLR
jgi:signal peptidase II